MASMALLKADLVALSKSWVLRGWLVALAFTEFWVLSTTMAASRGVSVAASSVLAGSLNLYLFVWSTFIIVLAAGSVSLEADMIADSILCRACTRTQYIVGKIASRSLVILGAYFVFSGIAGYVTWRFASSDMTVATMLTGIGIVGMAVFLLVALGVMMSVVFNNTIVSCIALLLLWYVASPIFMFVGADYLSPSSLTRTLPLILKDPTAPQVVQCTATTSSVTVAFSKDLRPERAEDVANYVVECPAGVVQTAQTAVYEKPRTSVVLSGLTLAPGQTVKVTVRGVTDVGGNEVSPAADTATATVPAEAKSASANSAPNVRSGPAAKPGTAAAPSAQSKPKPAAGRTTGDRQPPRVTQCTATASSVKVTFSEEIDPKDAEKTANYLVESPMGKMQSARAATYSPSGRSVLLSGLVLDPAFVRVTVKDVRDMAGNVVASSGNSALFREVSNWKYVLGFGLPALFCTLFGIVWFSRRDL